MGQEGHIQAGGREVWQKPVTGARGVEDGCIVPQSLLQTLFLFLGQPMPPWPLVLWWQPGKHLLTHYQASQIIISSLL